MPYDGPQSTPLPHAAPPPSRQCRSRCARPEKRGECATQPAPGMLVATHTTILRLRSARPGDAAAVVRAGRSRGPQLLSRHRGRRRLDTNADGNACRRSHKQETPSAGPGSTPRRRQEAVGGRAMRAIPQRGLPPSPPPTAAGERHASCTLERCASNRRCVGAEAIASAFFARPLIFSKARARAFCGAIQAPRTRYDRATTSRRCQ